MIDLLRVGGITRWVKVAGMAEAVNLPVVSHLVAEIHVHLVAAVPERPHRRVHAVDVASACRSGDPGSVLA
jgi:L-alanine-DL-glutamate epimerase-like enolase superfamily enzyme